MTTDRRLTLTLDSPSGLDEDTAPGDLSLDRILAAVGALPKEALFLGMAADGLPVLLNLHDPHPGPMLVVGERGAGKTAFLQSVARALPRTPAGRSVQYGVITAHADEWKEMGESAHRLGLFDVNQASAQEFIRSLASWAHSNRMTRGSILVLVDDLEALAGMDADALQNFRWLLLRGPVRGVWPILTMEAERYGQVLAWIELFRARVFGRVGDPRVAEALGGDHSSALDQLEAGRQFTLRENGNWLRFWLPSF